MRRPSPLVTVLVLTLVVTACTADPDEPDNPDETNGPVQPQTSPPADEVAVLADDDPGALAVEVSRALYDRSPVIVLADGADGDGHRHAADWATELGAPLLLTPEAGNGADPALREEITRLAPETVLTHGEAAARWAEQLAGEVEVVLPDPAADPATTPPTQPPTKPPEPLAGLAVLTNGAAHTIAAAATAQAAGARVLVTDTADPRGDPDVIAALADQPPTHTLALGADFAPVEQLRDRLAVATTGVQLPGGGQVMFPGRRIVALYGHPGSSVLGALGEQSQQQTIARALRVAEEYEDLTDEPVVPALEIITTIASASPGPQGDYSRRTPPDQLRGWIDAAAEAGLYVVLDLQPGHTDFLAQAQEYEELLVEPHVGLALDPEWRLAPDQRHMVNIGSVDAAEVNQVVEWVAELTAAHQLPQKLLILHQFQLRMITDRGGIDTGRDEVAVLIHADGFGTPGQKLDTWRALRADAPSGMWWGWKNFYDEDRPTFTPAETVAVEPSPLFISYQ